MTPSASASFAPATISLTQSTASLKSATCMYSVTRDLVFFHLLGVHRAADRGGGVRRRRRRRPHERRPRSLARRVALLRVALGASPSPWASRHCARRRRTARKAKLCFPPPIEARLLEDPPPVLPFLPTTSQPSPGPLGNKISSVCAGETPTPPPPRRGSRRASSPPAS